MDPRLAMLLRSPVAGHSPVGRRVLMVVPTIARGGCERRLISTAEGLIEQGYDVEVFVLEHVPAGAAAFEDEFKKLGAEFMEDFEPTTGDETTADGRVPLAPAGCEEGNSAWHAVQTLAPAVRRQALAVAQAIRSSRPEIVHGWGDHAATGAGAAACLLGVPRVIIGQTNIAPVHHAGGGAAIYLDIYREILRNPNVTMVANSRAVAADYEAWIGLRKGAVRVVYNGLSPTTVRIPRRSEVAAYRASLGFAEGMPVVGSVARFADQKDPMLWLQTAAEIAKSRQDVRFLLAGYGPLRDEVLGMVAALGLEGRCVVQGPVTDVGLVYAALDVFLLTSKFEGLPNVLIEAQSVGLPIVSTEYRGVCEAVIEDVTARIVPERSGAALAKSVIDAIADEAWVRRAREQGPLLVRRRFSHGRMVDETMDLYERPSRQSWLASLGWRRPTAVGSDAG
jgi:glycosyltransferase involved in cell wall biosynthesis